MKNKLWKSLLSWLLVFSMVFPLFSSVISTQAADGDINDYDAMSMEEIFESEEPLTWVITGDSITHNGTWTAGANSYGEWFEQYLYGLEERRNDSVVLTGWGGAQTRDFLETSPTAEGTNEDPGMGVRNFITKYNPDVITIKLGMNDRYITTAEFRGHYNQMLDDIYSICAEEYSKKPKIILLSPTPLQSENIYDENYHVDPKDAIEESTLRFRNEIEKIAEERNLLFCDLRTAFLEAQKVLGEDYAHTFFSDASDGLHPNPAGQYCMFKVLCKTMGIDVDKEAETKSIFQLTYDDLNLHAMYTDETKSVDYSGFGNTYTADDNAEKNNTKEPITDKQAIAQVEFDSTNGYFDGTTHLDIDTNTEGGPVVDPLTLEDVQDLGKEFTLVFRANLDTPTKKNQPVLSFSPDELAEGNWDNAFLLGTQGNVVDSDDDEIFYQVKRNSTGYVNGGNTINLGYSTTANDNLWHTIAIVQRTDCFEYYIDGKKIGFNDTTRVLKESIGTLFANDTTFDAKIGLYGSNATAYNLKGHFDYWHFYGAALTADEIATYYSEPTNNWGKTVQENYTWAVMGGTQMAGYDGPVVNRSLMRYLENAMRASSSIASYRDIHMYNLATPGYSVADMVDENKYNILVDGRNYDVFLLLPEVPELYEGTYSEEDLAEFVVTYKANIETLIERNSGKEIILWTPLASNDATINSYITACAEAVRTIATENTSIYFFDANKFMNDNMTSNSSLANNWFDDGQYLSQLGAVDVARAFYNDFKVGGKLGKSELSDHNLRYTTDTNVYKGKYVRDYLPTIAEVEGETVSLDVSAITSKYPNANLKIAILPYKNAGDYNKDIIELKDVATITEVNDGYTFKAPCADLHLAIYGEDESKEVIYRFKDISLIVNTEATLPEVTPEPLKEVCLDSLEVMSAQDIVFNKDTTTYEVELYSYQTYIRLRATAKAGITIKVDDQVVASNALSDPIKVDDGDTITVTASGTVDGKTQTETKTYTLNLTRPEYPDIIITEVMQDGYSKYTATGNDNYELIEIYNTTNDDLNLLDYSIGFKKDYSYNDVTVENGGEYPYYFTGNDQAFSNNATHTGIKELTKYSMYWGDDYTEPETITFKAHSTMVIWVKYSSQDTELARELYGDTLTYDTMLNALKKHAGTHTLTTEIDGEETTVVPSEEQLVIAETSVDAASKGLDSRAQTAPSNPNWYLDNFQANNGENNRPTRGWLFLLKDGENVSATVPENGTITAEGNNIISAAKWVRPGGTDKLSSVFSYNTTRGMSLVKNEGSIDFTKVGTGVTSDVMGYSNLTSFGAIEYWQKPTDFSDTKAPTIKNSTSYVVGEHDEGIISVEVSDDVDVRYLELYVRGAGEDEFTKVATKDFVLEAGVKNAGVSKDITSVTYTYSLGTVTDDVEYYVTVVDGNGNMTSAGTAEEPCSMAFSPQVIEEYDAEKAKAYIGTEVPECSQTGYLFAGWYADKECRTTPILTADKATGKVYALFVDDDVLSVRAQISSNLLIAKENDDSTASIRFVTTVDSLRYLKAGFDVSYDKDGDGEPTTVTSVSNKVYKILYAVGTTTNDELVEYMPDVFSKASTYFKACIMQGITEDLYNMEFTVTPFWVTPDGLKVSGLTAVRTINDGLKNSAEAKIDDTYYTTLEEAVEAANANEDATTIVVLKDAEVESKLNITTDVTIQNQTRTDVTIYRGAGLAKADMFMVASGKTLTIKDSDEKGKFVLDGRTVAEADITDLKEVKGSTGTMISNSGTLNVENVTIQYVKNNANAYGPVIISKGTTNITDSTIANNTTGNNSGAIRVNAGKTIIRNSLFTNNTANTGGVIFTNGGELDISNSSFANNGATGSHGGAIVARNKTSVTNCTFIGNQAGTNGGAISVDKNTFTLNIKGCSFENNSAINNGGAVYLSSAGVSATFTETTNEGLFKANSAINGGAIYVNTCSTFSVTGYIFEDNSATTNGGAIYTGATIKDIGSCDFVSNSSSRGGAIYAAKEMTLNECDFTSNSTTEYGGAIFTTTAANGIIISNTRFRLNESTKRGGAISFSSSATLTDCIFEQNASKDNGGAIYVIDSATLTLIGTDSAKAVFEYNHAVRGGAIFVRHASLNVTGYTFDNNIALNTSTGAGALNLECTNSDLPVTANITSCIFTKNKALDIYNDGATITSDSDYPVIESSTEE